MSQCFQTAQLWAKHTFRNPNSKHTTSKPKHSQEDTYTLGTSLRDNALPLTLDFGRPGFESSCSHSPQLCGLGQAVKPLNDSSHHLDNGVHKLKWVELGLSGIFVERSQRTHWNTADSLKAIKKVWVRSVKSASFLYFSEPSPGTEFSTLTHVLS